MPQIYRAIRPMFKSNRWRICRDDLVCIVRGPEKGQTGKVLEVFKDKRVPEVIVEGRNMRKRKVRTGPNPDDFFVVTMEAPLHYSQVQVVDPQTLKPVRVVYMFTPEGEKVRVRKVPTPTVNDILPSPPEDPDPRIGLVGKKDTPTQMARKGTYAPAAGFPFRVRNLERMWARLHPDASPLGDDKGSGAAASGWDADENASAARADEVGLANGDGRGRVGLFSRGGVTAEARSGTSAGVSGSGSGSGSGTSSGLGVGGAARGLCTAGGAEGTAPAVAVLASSFAALGLRKSIRMADRGFLAGATRGWGW